MAVRTTPRDPEIQRARVRTPGGASLRVVARPAFGNRARNPYQSLLYTALGQRGVTVTELSGRGLAAQADIFHIHWPDLIPARPSLLLAVARSLLYTGLIWFMKRRGTRIVWTVHNLEPHEVHHPRLSARFLGWFRRRVDGVILLSRANQRAMLEAFPELTAAPSVIVPIGHYRGVYPEPPDRESARAALDLTDRARVALFFGLLRPFKQVEALIETARQLDDPELTVIIAGKADDPAYVARLRAAAGDDSRIRLIPGFVPDSRVSLLFAAADLVVLPFRDVTNSSSAVLAVSLNKPVLVPSMGSLPELAAVVGPQWVRLYGGVLDPPTLAAALDWANTPGRPPCADLSALDWKRIAERTEAFYRAVLGGDQR